MTTKSSKSKVLQDDEPEFISNTKKYIAVLTQTGTAAPVATVRFNNLGGALTWHRDGSAGHYNVTCAGLFTIGKTDILINGMTSNNFGDYIIAAINDINEIDVSSATPDGVGGYGASDDIINVLNIEIHVYP